MPWNKALRWEDDHTKVLMISVVPKWCIDSKIYVAGGEYKAPDWPIKFYFEDNNLIAKRTISLEPEYHKLYLGKEWTGAWKIEPSQNNKDDVRVPDLDTTLMDQKYAQDMSELIHNPTTKFKEGQEDDGSRFIVIEDHSKALAYPQEDVLLTAPNSQAQSNRNANLIAEGFKKLTPEIKKELSGHRTIWVSPYPQIRDFLSSITGNDVEMRRNLLVRMYTGLPILNKTVPEQYAVEMWINPHDLIRTCPDPQIINQYCVPSAPFTQNVPQSYENIFSYLPHGNEATYQFWFKANTENAYHEPNGFPWTRLGYTYNWNPNQRSRIGVSEFIVRPGATVKIKDVYPLADYPSAK